MREQNRNARRRRSAPGLAVIVGAVIALLLLPGGMLFAQSTQGRSASASANGPMKLSITQAVQDALSHSSDLRSALAAAGSAQFKALEAKLQMLPSVSLSGSYAYLSSLPASDSSITLPLPAALGGPTKITIPTQQNTFSFGVSVSYPVFAGFRLLEAAKIAALQASSSQVATAIVKNALTFEVERAYWESVLATENVTTMQKNLELSQVLLKQTKAELDQGLATESDFLSAQEGYNQAQIMLADSISARNQAFLALSSLLGQDSLGASLAQSGSGGFSASSPVAYSFATSPTSDLYPQLSGALDPSKLVQEALANRPEVQTATLGVETAKSAQKAAQGALYPTLALIGNYTYASPNQRAPYAPADTFVGTWDVGVALSIDVGKLPANAAGALSQARDLSKAEAQAASERTSVVLDVRKSLLAYEQARQDLALTKSMVPQAEENLRVTRQKFANGLAKHSDVLQAELALLRAQFAVTNQQVNEQISAADLARAVAIGGALK